MKRLWIVALFMLAASAAGAQAACNAARCDINGDGLNGTPADYIAFYGALGTTVGIPKFNPRADFDGDGGVTPKDYGILIGFCPLGNSK